MQIRNNMNHDAQSGGSFITISRATLPSKSVTCPVVRTNVPNSPAETFFISAPRLMMLPQRVKNNWLTTSPNTEGMKNIPNRAALATTRHLTSAEMAWDNSANSKIHTTLPTKIAPARYKLSANQPAPSRYA